MQKILFVTDALRFNTKAIDFAAYICKLSNSKLTAIFLENETSETRSRATIRERVMEDGTYTAGVSIPELKRESSNENIQRFLDACITHDINGVVHRDIGVPVLEVIHESLYADLILVDAETSFANGGRRCQQGL